LAEPKSGIDVLVIDDDESCLEMTGDYLEFLGHCITVSASAGPDCEAFANLFDAREKRRA